MKCTVSGWAEQTISLAVPTASIDKYFLLGLSASSGRELSTPALGQREECISEATRLLGTEGKRAEYLPVSRKDFSSLNITPVVSQ